MTTAPTSPTSPSPPWPTRVTLVGLGAIGREVLKAILGKSSLRIVAVADPAPAYLGRDAGVITDVGPLGLPVVGTLDEALGIPTDVVVVLTTSGSAEMLPIVELAAARGAHVVSSCEDLAFAEHATPEVARRIDAVARSGGIAVLGTGVNPGFVMDRLPLVLAGACVAVRGVSVQRVVDAAKRRAPLRAKVGAGQSVEEFQAGVAARRFGHRGLPESVVLLATGLGWKLDDVRATIAPVVATLAEPREGIDPGRVAGLRQTASGIVGGEERIRLDLEMSVAAPNPRDHVRIDGDPPLDVLITGGTQGDRGTVGTVVNALGAIRTAAPGLRHVSEMALLGIVS